MKALIVEDNEDSRVLLENVLESDGFEVQGAKNGRDAISRMTGGFVPHIIVSDILMPEMDGYALCRFLKEDARFHSIPFVFYTATYTDPRDERLAMKLGAARFFVKPLDMSVLLNELHSLLAEHGPEPETQGSGKEKEPFGEPGTIEQEYSEVLGRKLDKKIKDLEAEKEKYRQSEEKYRRLVEALRHNYFFYTHDTNGILTYLSPSVTEVMGYSQEELFKHYSTLLSDNPINKDVHRYTELALQGVRQPPYELEAVHKDGSLKRLEVTEQPIFDRLGRVIAVEGIAHDITETRQLEEQLRQSQKIEALGTLAGGIAHDFNNFLSAIIGYTELIQLKLPDTVDLTEEVESIRVAVERAAGLVRQILTFSRKTGGERRLVQPAEILSEALKMLRASLPASIRIEERIDPDCGMIRINPNQLHQIIVNLCTNAAQAMAGNKGRLQISLTREDHLPGHPSPDSGDAQTAHVVLRVADNGCGMDERTLERIFDPYFTTKQVGEGTGLGLAVVHGIVQENKGVIEVESRLGEGSCFSISFPVANHAEVREKSPVVREQVSRRGQVARILVVDDDPFLVKIYKALLEKEGHTVAGFTDSRKALEEIRGRPDAFDLVMTDQSMPELTGEELAAAVVEIRPDMPIIVCSGHYLDGEAEGRKKSGGICRYLGKPVLHDQLIKAVRDVLG